CLNFSAQSLTQEDVDAIVAILTRRAAANHQQGRCPCAAHPAQNSPPAQEGSYGPVAPQHTNNDTVYQAQPAPNYSDPMAAKPMVVPAASTLPPTPSPEEVPRADKRRGKKGSRVQKTRPQKAMLYEEYKKCKYVDSSKLDRIAGSLGMTADKVLAWFQNKRYNEKKKAQKEKNSAAAK
uniref:Homeobox domain-containing protein n=1 Tax=Steinernema glaseri TaxID=37863 RepID=A0A1I7YGH7_9BILA